MKLIISEVASLADELLAIGIREWLKPCGVEVVDSRTASSSLPAGPADPSISTKPQAKAKQPGAAESGESKPTIRSRIIGYLKRGPQGSESVRKMLAADGIVSDSRLACQHLYLLTKAGLAEKADENTWRLKGGAQ